MPAFDGNMDDDSRFQEVWDYISTVNPWWRDRSYRPEEWNYPVRRKAFDESLEAGTDGSLRRFVFLTGVRRVGKTTLLKQLVGELLEHGVEPRNILYFSYDASGLSGWDLFRMVSRYLNLMGPKGKFYLFVDEIQYLPSWSESLKVIYDAFSNAEAFITGSSSTLLMKGSVESGAGRWREVYVPTLSFMEYTRFKGIDPIVLPSLDSIGELFSMDEIKRQEIMGLFSPMEPIFRDYLTIGGLPEYAKMETDDLSFLGLWQDTIQRVLLNDMARLFPGMSAETTEYLFRYICENSGSLFDSSAVAQRLGGVSDQTVLNYVKALSDAKLVYISRPIEIGGKKVFTRRRKVYATDTGIANSASINDPRDISQERLGLVAKTAVYKHLLECRLGMDDRVAFYREAKPSEKEVDMAFGNEKSYDLVEVKYRFDPRITRKDAILNFAASGEKGLDHAYVVTRLNNDIKVVSYGLKVPILRIPSHMFAYLLGSGVKLR